MTTASRAPTHESTGGSGWSLERRLPLLLLALLACVVGGFSTAAYREVRAAVIGRTTDALERGARELAAATARSLRTDLVRLRALAADSAVVAAASSGADRSPGTDLPARFSPRSEASTTPIGAADSGAAARRLARALAPALSRTLAAARQPYDSTLLGWELWTAAGTRLYASTSSSEARDSAVLATLRGTALQSDSIRRSPLYAHGDEIRLWTAIPVLVGGRAVALLAEHRRLPQSPSADQVIRGLAGQDVDVSYTSAGSADWASVGGTPVPPPLTGALPMDHTALVQGTRGASLYAVAGRVPGTPWRIVLTQSEASVLGRPHEFLRDMLGAGAVLLALGTLGAWLVGRHVARPLRRLTHAAAALAGGDYAQRVPVAGSAETAGLAARFNTMAAGLGEAHARLAERNTDLQRANAIKGQFLAMIGHELRTPLNAIAGYTELLELGLRGPVTPAQLEDLARIRRNKDDLLAIIDHILSLSRGDPGALALRCVELSVPEVFRRVVDAVGPSFQAKGVRLAIASLPNDATVCGDADRVQQILRILLVNAVKFTEPRGEVILACRLERDITHLDVRDTGIGIASESLEEIFEPFVQVDASFTRRAGGAGLGLSVARELASAMGGALTVESAPERGSVFSLTLPRAPAFSDGQPVERLADTRRPTPSAGTPTD